MVMKLAAPINMGAAATLLPATAVSTGAETAAGAMARPEGLSGMGYIPPPIDHSATHEAQLKITDQLRQPISEELEIYHRTKELFDAMKENPRLTMPERHRFSGWLHMETLAARFESRPVDLEKFAFRLCQVAALDDELRQIVCPFPDRPWISRCFDVSATERRYEHRNPYGAMIRFIRNNPGLKKEEFLRAWRAIFEHDEHFDRKKIEQFSGELGCKLSALEFLERNLDCDKRIHASYVESGMPFEELMQRIEARADELVWGAHLHIHGDDPSQDSLRSAVEMMAADMVLAPVSFIHHQVYKDVFQRIAIEPLDGEVHSRPFTFPISLQRPIQREIHLGIIRDYMAPILRLARNDTIVEMAKNVLGNGARNGLRIVYSDIKEFFARYGDGTGLELPDLITSRNVERFIDCVLGALAKHPKAIPGVKFLPDFLIASSILNHEPKDSLKPILSFRPTAPFDDVVAGLMALHDFYAEQVANEAAHYFGKGFRLPGKFLGRAADLLLDEVTKVQWMDSERAEVSIVPSRNLLDAFHASMGGRNCLLGYGFTIHSLTDPRFLPHRILLHGQKPGKTWKGGIYQMTIRARGLKIMILSGIDPQRGFNVNPGEFMAGLERNFRQIANEGDYDLILIDEIEGSSRKGTMLREIRERYPERFELSPEEAVGFPVKEPVVDGVPPQPHETKKFYMAHRHFRVMADLRQ